MLCRRPFAAEIAGKAVKSQRWFERIGLKPFKDIRDLIVKIGMPTHEASECSCESGSPAESVGMHVSFLVVEAAHGLGHKFFRRSSFIVPRLVFRFGSERLGDESLMAHTPEVVREHDNVFRHVVCDDPNWPRGELFVHHAHSASFDLLRWHCDWHVEFLLVLKSVLIIALPAVADKVRRSQALVLWSVGAFDNYGVRGLSMNPHDLM